MYMYFMIIAVVQHLVIVTCKKTKHYLHLPLLKNISNLIINFNIFSFFTLCNEGQKYSMNDNTDVTHDLCPKMNP